MVSATIAGQQRGERRLTGRGIAPGLALGTACVWGDVLQSSFTPILTDPIDVECELARLKDSFEETLNQLEQYAKRVEAEFDSSLGGVFRAHSEILRQLFTSGEFEHELRESLLTAEGAVRRVFQRWHQKFEALPTPILRQRADDVLDLGRGIIRRLRGEEDGNLPPIPEHSVLVVERLLPSDVVLLPKSNVMAVVVENLGQGSHAALLAREKGIPTITEIPGLLSLVAGGEELLVDGFRGTLVIAPAAITRSDFQERLEQWRTTLVRCKAECLEPARTLDDQLIEVDANVGIHDDVELALDNGADGVGLLRIEQLYFARPAPPTEDELFHELKTLITPLGNRTVTIRLLDIGGDKPLPYLDLPVTANPALGCRGARLLLNYSQLVRTQLGAILTLSREHSLRVLIPMVTLEDDIRRLREIFDTMSDEQKIASPPPFGAMIETPAAALAVPALLKHVQFFCAGTNDLTQYTLAAARDDASVNEYYLDGHESVMRLLEIVVNEAGDKPVTVCGELAGREEHVPRLLKMGFRSLSVAPTAIPTTKALIRTLNIGAATASGVR
jgi:phosphoenolpyruvate-protein phosphotransferase